MSVTGEIRLQRSGTVTFGADLGGLASRILTLAARTIRPSGKIDPTDGERAPDDRSGRLGTLAVPVRLRRLGRETWWLLAVVAGYSLTQPVLFHMRRFFSYDEAVYISQVYPGAVPIGFNAQRARGLPWLIAPVSLFSPPVVVVRYYLLAVSAVLMFVAFHAWVPMLRTRAAAAAALFAVCWTTLFYGTEIIPNLLVAFGDIAAAGYLAQHLARGTDEDRGQRRTLVKVAVAVAFVALVRPIEATWLAAGLLVAGFTRHPRLLVTRCAALGVGLFVGWLPWVIEAYARFGGPLARLRLAAGSIGSGFHPVTAWHQLTLTDGPLVGATDTTAPLLGYLWWLVLVIGIMFAIGRLIRYHDRTAAVAGIAGVAAAAQYLFFTTIVEARFLLPAYGLLAVCLAAALPSPPAALVPRVVAWTAITLCVALFAVWNARTADAIENQEYLAGQAALNVGEALRARNPGGQCFFASQFGFPEVSFASGCAGAIFMPSEPTIGLAEDPGSAPFFILTVTNPKRTKIRPVPGTVQVVPGTGSEHWWLFIAPRTAIRVVR